MIKYKRKNRSIHQKLSLSYGRLVAAVILIMIIFNVIMISQFKIKGIDALIQNYIEQIDNNITETIANSVKQHLKLENEKILSIAREYHKLVQEGYLSDSKAESFLIKLISESTMGESGYSYAIDSQGMMVAHPKDNYAGEDYISNELIQNQLNRQRGYLEYNEKNPENEKFLRKMLYMSPYEERGWIITTTTFINDKYIDQITITEIRDLIGREKTKSLIHLAMLDGDGNILISPENMGENTSAAMNLLNSRLEEIKTRKSGKMILVTEGENSANKRTVVHYSYLNEMDWIITGIGYTRDLYRPAINAYIIMAVAVIIVFTLFIFLSNKNSKQITEPLTDLMNTVNSSIKGDLSARAEIKTGDEIEILGEHFNRVMKSNQQYISSIDDARSEIKALAKFTNDNPNPVFRLDFKRRIEYANIKSQELILEPLGLVTGDRISEKLYADLNSINAISGRNEFEIGKKIFSFSVSIINDPEGIYFYGKDISKQKKFESLQLLSKNIFNNSIEGIVIADSKGIIESVNPAFTKITGYTSQEAMGKNPRILKSHRHNQDFYSDMWKQLFEKGHWSGEIWNRKKNGTVYPEYLTITSIKNENNEINQFISFFHDLSDIKEREERIIYESTHDKLTSLPNREFLLLKTAELIENAQKNNGGFSFLYLDINNFKRINESIGAESGDTILVEASKRLNELFKKTNCVIRIGGDEFVCILEDKKDAAEISNIVEDVLRVFKPSFIVGDHKVSLEISLGISTYPYDETQPLELLARAETAMRVSKKNVNSAYTFYSPSFKKEGLSRVEIESGLKAAFENQDFYLNYQPKVSSMTGKIIGSEALVRLKPINGQFIGPDIFIPVAEEIGLIEPLGTWVLEKAFQDTQKLIEKGFKDLHVAVNLSPWQFRNSALSTQVSNIIDSVGISPGNLNLEITESMAIYDVEESIKTMQKLTGLGLSLSIDDFGTGYSSLSSLSSFPVNILKIDKAFVAGIPENPKKTGIVLAILSLAANLGMQTVAEGVEHIEQYRFLKDRGCNQIQGYYFHKPMLLSELEEALNSEIS